MTAEQNQAIIRRLFEEVLNGGRVEVLDEIIAAGYVEHAALPGQDGGGPEGVRLRLATFRAAFPDMRWGIEDLISDEEKAVARWRMEATDEGGFMGMAPTGRRVAMTGIDIYRIVDGQLIEHWHEVDTLGLMQQLGIIPAP